MDNEEKCAITAIADVRLEGSIASSLHRLGWKVVYRATSDAGLRRALSDFPQALVISSDDFRLTHEIKAGRQVSLSVTAGGMTDSELRELLRKTNESKGAPERILLPIKSRTYLVASNGRTVGASTISLNLAQELSRLPGSTLLLDCNSWSPYLARHLSMNGINREIARSPFGFSVGEIFTRESLSELSTSLTGYDRIVIDFGQIQNFIATANGRRVHEEILSWSIHGQSHLLLVSRSDTKALEQAARTLEQAEQISPGMKRHFLISLTSVLSGRERARLIANSMARFGTSCSLVSQDRRSVLQIEEKGSTFTHAAPKSMVLGELRDLAEELA